MHFLKPLPDTPLHSKPENGEICMRILGSPQACCFSVLALILIYVAVNTVSRRRRNGNLICYLLCRIISPQTTHPVGTTASSRNPWPTGTTGSTEANGTREQPHWISVRQRMPTHGSCDFFFVLPCYLFRRILSGDRANVCHPTKPSHIIVVSVGGGCRGVGGAGAKKKVLVLDFSWLNN